MEEGDNTNKDHKEGAALLAPAEAWRRQAAEDEDEDGSEVGVVIGGDGVAVGFGDGLTEDADASAAIGAAAGAANTSSNAASDAAADDDGDDGNIDVDADAPAMASPAFGVNSRRAAEWQSKLNNLLAYKKEHGDCRVPKDYTPNPPLAMWCDNQRRQNKLRSQGKKSSMTDERVSALNEIGFWWGWRIVPFEDRLEELKKFRDEHGTCRVTNADGPSHHGLRDWLKSQRERYHTGHLGDDRKAALEEVGFDFGARMAKWEDHFAELLKFREEFGHCNVSKEEHDSNEPWSELLKWVKRQRALYATRLREGKGEVGAAAGDQGEEAADQQQQPQKVYARTKDFGLTDERLAKLEEVGFLFNTWDTRYSELLAYRKKRGGCIPKVPAGVESARKYARHVADSKDGGGDGVGDVDGEDDDADTLGTLVRWLANQRKSYPSWLEGDKTATTLTDSRVIRLLKVGFELEPPLDEDEDGGKGKGAKGKDDDKTVASPMPDTAWRKQISVLKSYRDLYGHTDVPAQFGMNRDLANWVQQVRSAYRCMVEEGTESCGCLTAKRVDELRSLGLSLTREEEIWREKLREVAAYADERGEAAAYAAFVGSSGAVGGGKRQVDLRRWVTQQREQLRLHRRGEGSTLDDAKAAALEAADFPFEEETEAADEEDAPGEGQDPGAPAKGRGKKKGAAIAIATAAAVTAIAASKRGRRGGKLPSSADKGGIEEDFDEDGEPIVTVAKRARKGSATKTRATPAAKKSAAAAAKKKSATAAAAAKKKASPAAAKKKTATKTAPATAKKRGRGAAAKQDDNVAVKEGEEEPAAEVEAEAEAEATPAKNKMGRPTRAAASASKKSPSPKSAPKSGGAKTNKTTPSPTAGRKRGRATPKRESPRTPATKRSRRSRS